jgi:hypothetical protein
MLVIGLLWLVTYKMLGGWSGGEGGFALNSNYILNKLKVLYILNFNWIFTVIVIIGIIYILICNRDKIKNITWIMPIVCSTFVFTVFSFLFNTSNHARYSAQVPAVLYIIGTALILYLIREKYAEIILAVLSILLFISSFFTVDPVSKLCFETANVGDMEMLSTGDTVPGDSMIYNKQMLCFEYVLNQAIEEAVNNDYMVIMPMRGGSPNLFDGLMQNKVSQDYGYISETYWSYDTGTRSMYGDGDTLEFNIYELKSTADISQLPLEENEKHVFIYSKLLGEESAQMIMNQYPEAEYREYNAKGWSISVLVF